MTDPLALIVARHVMAERLARAEADRTGRLLASTTPSSRPPARPARRRARRLAQLRVLRALRG